MITHYTSYQQCQTVSNNVNSVNSVNSVNNVNSYSAVLPPAPMVFFNWLSLNLIGHPNHALDIYLMNLSLPGLLLAAWHQARSSRPRTAGRTCSQRRVTSRRRQGQNHQFQGFRSLFRNIFRKTMKHEVECMYVSSWLQFISPGSCARRVNELVEISVEKSCVGGRFVAIISIASF